MPLNCLRQVRRSIVSDSLDKVTTSSVIIFLLLFRRVKYKKTESIIVLKVQWNSQSICSALVDILCWFHRSMHLVNCILLCTQGIFFATHSSKYIKMSLFNYGFPRKKIS